MAEYFAGIMVKSGDICQIPKMYMHINIISDILYLFCLGNFIFSRENKGNFEKEFWKVILVANMLWRGGPSLFLIHPS